MVMVVHDISSKVMLFFGCVMTFVFEFGICVCCVCFVCAILFVSEQGVRTGSKFVSESK